MLSAQWRLLAVFFTWRISQELMILQMSQSMQIWSCHGAGIQIMLGDGFGGE
jgi:hypothetical protein